MSGPLQRERVRFFGPRSPGPALQDNGSRHLSFSVRVRSFILALPFIDKAMLLSHLHEAVRKGAFSLRFVAADGEVVHIPRCVCSSWYSRGSTMNIKVCESGQVRKINRVTIIEVNGKEAYL